jgi:hypothetical protein
LYLGPDPKGHRGESATGCIGYVMDTRRSADDFSTMIIRQFVRPQPVPRTVLKACAPDSWMSLHEMTGKIRSSVHISLSSAGVAQICSSIVTSPQWGSNELGLCIKFKSAKNLSHVCVACAPSLSATQSTTTRGTHGGAATAFTLINVTVTNGSIATGSFEARRNYFPWVIDGVVVKYVAGFVAALAADATNPLNFSAMGAALAGTGDEVVTSGISATVFTAVESGGPDECIVAQNVVVDLECNYPLGCIGFDFLVDDNKTVSGVPIPLAGITLRNVRINLRAYSWQWGVPDYSTAAGRATMPWVLELLVQRSTHPRAIRRLGAVRGVRVLRSESTVSVQALVAFPLALDNVSATVDMRSLVTGDQVEPCDGCMGSGLRYRQPYNHPRGRPCGKLSVAVRCH